MRCGKRYGENIISETDGVPECKCRGIVRPDVVLYGEGLNVDVFADAEKAIRKAELLIVGGTSLTVNPAASLVSLFRGHHMVIINYSETPYDSMADIIIRASVAEVLPMLL